MDRTHSISPLLARVALAAGCLVGLSGVASAQSWVGKMFETTDHDFGVVARGSDTVYKFPVKNVFKEDVVISSVRSSCGCTTASLENKELETFETGYVVAKFNTRTFTGVHSATLTVSISKPYPASIQLRVHGNIRGDVVFEPGSIDFGTVDQGTSHEKTIAVTYAGRSGWQITDVRSVEDHLQAELVQRSRSSRGATYDLLIRMTESAPAGFRKSQLVIVTNDASNPRIPIEVAADVRPELTVAPENLVLGDVEQGQSVTKRLLVRGKRPFKITAIDSGDDAFDFDAGGEPDTKQIVTVRFTAGEKLGRLRAPITIATDLGDSFQTQCTAYANVVPSGEAAPADGAQDGDSRTALVR